MSGQRTPPAIAADANQALGVAGHSDMVWGHASVRDPDGRGVWMKAAGYAFEEVTEDRVVLVSSRGEVLDGRGERHLEYPIHTELMAARPDVNAVVHTHAQAAVAFASLGVPLRAISHDAISFLDPDVPRFNDTGNLITTEDQGKALAACLGDAAGLLIPNHGLVTVGDTPAVAVMLAVLLARACDTQLRAIAANGPAEWSSDDEVREKRATITTPGFFTAGYAYLLRRAAGG
ncbi:MAG: class II aldolase/adducin family protein [Propionibacteriales bacterium]|nr:class II aldolase/adducin family protein [Propionibacteriales bacterium]